MFDLWTGGVEITTLVLIFSVAVLFPVQLLLCFKVKSLFIRLMPAALLSVGVVIFTILFAVATDWGKLGYLILDLFTLFMLLVCGLGWAVWALVKLIRRKRL